MSQPAKAIISGFQFCVNRFAEFFSHMFSRSVQIHPLDFAPRTQYNNNALIAMERKASAMKQPVLLCYNLEKEKAAKIRLAAMRFRIRVRPVSTEEYERPLNELCSVEALPQTDAFGAFQDEMLVMAYFPQALVMQFLQALRKAGVAPVALKAVLTPTNAGWSSVALHTELCKEREAFESGGQAAHAQETQQS